MDGQPMNRLWIDQNVCTGHRRCYSLAPELFDDGDDGYGTVSAPGNQIDDTSVVDAGEAVRSCPEGAVHLEANPEP
jgi:ferredoxin